MILIVFLFIVLMVFSIAFFLIAMLFIHSIKFIKEQSDELYKKRKIIASSMTSNEIDHTFYIKLCIEIIRMKKRLDRSEVKDKRHLQKSLERIEDSFRERGYEIISYEGSQYNEGMSLIANFIPSEDLKKGERIITRVIKPQINYKSSMIHSAEVEVSYGE